MKLTQWIKEEIKMKIRKYNEMNGNGNDKQIGRAWKKGSYNKLDKEKERGGRAQEF